MFARISSVPDKRHLSVTVSVYTLIEWITDCDILYTQDIELDWTFTSYAAKLNINKNKNRYINIIPCTLIVYF